MHSYSQTDHETKASVVLTAELSRLVGKLCEAVEVLGLPESQEAAIKRLVKRTVYDTQNLAISALRGEYEGSGT